MRLYALSCVVGLLVGAIYGVLDVKSPAPPVVALIGLLGMLGGEQVGKKIAGWHLSLPTTNSSIAHERPATGAKPLDTN